MFRWLANLKIQSIMAAGTSPITDSVLSRQSHSMPEQTLAQLLPAGIGVAGSSAAASGHRQRDDKHGDPGGWAGADGVADADRRERACDSRRRGARGCRLVSRAPSRTLATIPRREQERRGWPLRLCVSLICVNLSPSAVK